jgi:hypothetical protein
MKTLSKHILKDYAKSERANRIFLKWENRAREFRCLEFKSLKLWNKAQYRWSLLPFWERDQYRAAVRKMSDAELKSLAN